MIDYETFCKIRDCHDRQGLTIAQTARKATAISLLVVLGVRADGQKVLLSVRNMGGESEAAWRAVLDDLVKRGLKQPELAIVDGASGLEKALGSLWSDLLIQRCTVHKLRNLIAHAPKRLAEEVASDFSDMVYADSAKQVATRRKAFIRKWPASADVERFEKRHPIGSKARLALALLIYTGVRRSDVVSLGRQHLRNGVLVFRQHKGRNRSPLTLDLPVLPVLQAIMDASPTGDLSFLVTEQSKPFTAAGFTNWFRERCNEAGLPGLSAHGLRKAGATRAAENGATAHQLMAIFGWRTIKQAEAYTRAAERKRLASGAMHLLGTKSVEMFPTLDPQEAQVGKKGPKK